MKIVKINGDVVDLCKIGLVDVVAHGCNCFHTMGSGVAYTLNKISSNKLLIADHKTPYGDINKLGTSSVVKGVMVGNNPIDIYNIYSQYIYGQQDSVMVHWESVFNALDYILTHNVGKRIAIPYIGCGLANGKEEDLMNVLNRLTFHSDKTKFYLVKFV